MPSFPLPGPENRKPRIDAVLFVALLLETLLVGIFYVLLIQTFEALRFRAKTRHQKFFKPITFCALALLGTITTRWITDISRAYRAFILPEGSYCIEAGQPNPAETVFMKLSESDFVVGCVMNVLSAVLGDSFMIYRLWIIWGKNKLIIIPPIIFMGGIAITGTVIAWGFKRYDITILETNGPWIICFYISTFLCNTYSTALIALKIFLSSRKLRKTHTQPRLDLSKVAEILVESAALYSCCIIIAAATFLGETSINTVTVAASSPITGIAFCMIVTRGHKAATKGTIISDLSYQRSGGGNAVPMQPFAVRITTQSQIDGGSLDLANPTLSKVLQNPT